METREQGRVTWAMLLRPSPALRRMLLVGIGVAVSQQARAAAGQQNKNCTGLAQIARLIRALKLARNLGQPCTIFVQGQPSAQESFSCRPLHFSRHKGAMGGYG